MGALRHLVREDPAALQKTDSTGHALRTGLGGGSGGDWVCVFDASSIFSIKVEKMTCVPGPFVSCMSRTCLFARNVANLMHPHLLPNKWSSFHPEEEFPPRSEHEFECGSV